MAEIAGQFALDMDNSKPKPAVSKKTRWNPVLCALAGIPALAGVITLPFLPPVILESGLITFLLKTGIAALGLLLATACQRRSESSLPCCSRLCTCLMRR